MKKFYFRKLSIYIGLVLLLLHLAGLVTATPAPQADRSGAPSVVSYQGQVIVGGTPYSGTGYFKFAIVNSLGTTSYWSNDGSSGMGSEPFSTVTLTVDTGLFNVLLGDTTISGMGQTLSASVFSEKNRYLRVWFSSDGSSFQQLSPDQRIAAVPYAMQAEYALQAENAADADTLDGLEGSAYQPLIGGTCYVGSTIQSINADGSVKCEAHDTRLGFSQLLLDSAGEVGRFTSITIGVDGLPVISYYDVTNGDLKVVHCGDAACSTGNTLTTLDTVGNVGRYTAIAIGADGLPVISYQDHTNNDLKVAHCENVTCTQYTLITVDSSNNVGEFSSITIGADGLPVISYLDRTDYNLMVAHCGDAGCSTGNTLTLVDSLMAGEFTSITIGGDGLPVISYVAYDSELKVAHCGDKACSTGNIIAELDSSGLMKEDTSITIGGDGLPVISYYDKGDGDLKVAHCENRSCTTVFTIYELDTEGDVGKHSSISIGGDGLPVISYYDVTNGDLKVAHCGDFTCSMGNTFTTLDTKGDVGKHTAITIGVDGLPVVSYFKEETGNLKVAHCSNVFCTPYWRRR